MISYTLNDIIYDIMLKYCIVAHPLSLLALSSWQHELVPDEGEGPTNAQNQLHQCILGYISRQQPGLQGFNRLFYQGCQAHPDQEIDLHNHDHHRSPWT
jgi:hypothetical protein